MNLFKIKFLIRRALLSVSDKTGLIPLCEMLHGMGVELVSTGGTASAIKQAGIPVTQVSDVTGFPEILDGRVKTLHPSVHGALLARRNNDAHVQALKTHGIENIDLVVVNLYPFQQAVKQYRANPSAPNAYDLCIENIDVGGPCMLRSAAKNHAFLTVLSSVDQYAPFTAQLTQSQGYTSYNLRKALATEAFKLTSQYDTAISSFLNEVNPSIASFQTSAPAASSSTSSESSEIVRRYQPAHTLKYGCNPHQKPAAICSVLSSNGTAAQVPFKIVNGTPGYINLLDAINACQLVFELKKATGGLCAAASFKHVSPTGAAVALHENTLRNADGLGVDSSVAKAIAAQQQQITNMLGDGKAQNLTCAATSYLLARGCDPKCSFGDFCALSDVVDEATALVLKTEVSDGIIAPGFTEPALAILKQKKNGAYIILQSDADFAPPAMEYREVYGVCFSQRRNDLSLNVQNCFGNSGGSGELPPSASSSMSTTSATPASNAQIVTNNKNLPTAAKLDLLLAAITAKFTQSNSVAFAKNGQIVGVGAGQQSRIDCVKLAGSKVRNWCLRQHPTALSLPFKPGTKKTERTNAIVRYIEGDFTKTEREEFDQLFTSSVHELSKEDKDKFCSSFLSDVSLCSDGFFPFRDNIDEASKYGVKYILQPGGSVADAVVVGAANSYDMTMVHNQIRLFHH